MLSHLISKARKGVILDTNLFLVLLIGNWNINEISKFKRTSSYSIKDYDYLVKIINNVGKLATTPHILTEVCNLTDSLNKNNKYSIYKVLAHIQNNAGELHQAASLLMQESIFLKLGIADSSLIDASKKGYLVITDDAACYAVIAGIGGLVININHARSREWLTS